MSTPSCYCPAPTSLSRFSMEALFPSLDPTKDITSQGPLWRFPPHRARSIPSIHSSSTPPLLPLPGHRCSAFRSSSAPQLPQMKGTLPGSPFCVWLALCTVSSSGFIHFLAKAILLHGCIIDPSMYTCCVHVPHLCYLHLMTHT